MSGRLRSPAGSLGTITASDSAATVPSGFVIRSQVRTLEVPDPVTRQRTTTYEPVSPERAEAALGFDRLSRALLPMVPAATGEREHR